MNRILLSAAGGAMPAHWIGSINTTSDYGTTDINVTSLGDIVLCGGGPGTLGGSIYVLNSDGEIKKSVATVISGSTNFNHAISTDSSGNFYYTNLRGTGKLTSAFASSVAATPASLGGSTSLSLNGCIDSSGNIYTAGYAAAITPTTNRFGVRKSNSAGTFQWSKFVYESSAQVGVANSVGVDSSGNVYVYGSVTSATPTIRALLVKYDSSGTYQWGRTLTAPSGNIGGLDIGNRGGHMACDADGNCYVTGYSVTSTKIFVAKYDSSGVLAWQRLVTVSQLNASSPKIHVDSGGVYVAFANAASASFAKYSTSGTLQYARSLSISGYAVNQASNLTYGIWPIVRTANSGLDVVFCCDMTKSAAPMMTTIMKVPADGTKTGTYSIYIYSVASLTETAGDLTDAAASLTELTGSSAGGSGPTVTVCNDYQTIL